MQELTAMTEQETDKFLTAMINGENAALRALDAFKLRDAKSAMENLLAMREWAQVGISLCESHDAVNSRDNLMPIVDTVVRACEALQRNDIATAHNILLGLDQPLL